MTDLKQKSPSSNLEDRLITWISPILEPMGFEIVSVEIMRHREKRLRLFIDRIATSVDGATTVSVDDCALVSRTLDEPFEASELIKNIFGETPYELEVSSPGIERPLRSERDFNRFQGQNVRVHTFRALSALEIQNEDYFKKNPRQKNFTGILDGYEGDFLWLKSEEGSKQQRISIPVSLISKANLEPDLSQILRKADQEHKKEKRA